MGPGELIQIISDACREILRVVRVSASWPTAANSATTDR
jgi:hypothetical protein